MSFRKNQEIIENEGKENIFYQPTDIDIQEVEEADLKLEEFKKTHPTLLEIWENIQKGMSEKELACACATTYYLGKYTYKDPDNNHIKHATYKYLESIDRQENLVKLFPKTWNAISINKGNNGISIKNRFNTFFEEPITAFHFGEIYDACREDSFIAANKYLGKGPYELTKFFNNLYYLSSDGKKINLDNKIIYSALHNLEPDEARERFIEIYDKPIKNPVCDEIRQLYEEEWKQQNVHQEPINIQPMNSSNNISPSLQSSSFLENWNRNMTPSKNMTPSNPGTYLPFPFRLKTQPLNDSSKQTFQQLQPLLDIENNFSLQEEETNHDAFQKTHPTLFDIWKNIRLGMSEAELAKKLKVTSSYYQVTPSYYLGKYTYQDPKGHTKHATYEDLKKIESQENLVKLFPETWNAISLNMGEKSLSKMVNNHFKTFAQTETKDFHFGEIYDACKKSTTFTAANEYLGKSRGELSKFFKSLYYISSDGEKIVLVDNNILYSALNKLKPEALEKFEKIYNRPIKNPVCDEIRQLYEEEWKQQNVHQESLNTQPVNIQPMNNNISPSPLQYYSILQNSNRYIPCSNGSPFPFRLKTQPLNNSSQQTFQNTSTSSSPNEKEQPRQLKKQKIQHTYTELEMIDFSKTNKK